MWKLKTVIKLSCISFWFSPLAFADSIPAINNIGIVPAQFDVDYWKKLNITKEVDTLTDELIKESKRFRTLEPKLVDELWNTPEGRQELKKDYRLESFINISFLMKKDHVIATARLMSPELKLFLQESEIWPLKTAESSDAKEIKEALRSLIYRLFNILPIDINVTSIQDSFITLSGGIEQSIHVGDSVNLVRVEIQSLHPALGTWQSFRTTHVGKAKIIESRNNVSVARLTSELKSGGIAIGDGAHIDGIFSRRLFAAETEKAKTFKSPGILIPPLQVMAPVPETISKVGNSESKNQQVSNSQDNPNNQEPRDIKPGSMKPVETFTDRSHNVPESQEENSSSNQLGGTSQEEQTSTFAENPIPLHLEQIDLWAGHSSWSYSLPASASSKWIIFPPLNTYGAKTELALGQNLAVGADLELGFGGTKNGSFKSYSGEVSGRWKTKIKSVPLLDSWHVGLKAALRGKSVDQETFGGLDLLQGGIQFGIKGSIPAAKKLAFEAAYALVPLSLGRIGYSGSFKSLRSALGSEISGQLLSGYKYLGLEVGGGMHYSDFNMLDSSGKETVFNRISLEFIARKNLN